MILPVKRDHEIHAAEPSAAVGRRRISNSASLVRQQEFTKVRKTKPRRRTRTAGSAGRISTSSWIVPANVMVATRMVHSQNNPRARTFAVVLSPTNRESHRRFVPIFFRDFVFRTFVITCIFLRSQRWHARHFHKNTCRSFTNSELMCIL